MRIALISAIFDLKSRSDYFHRSASDYLSLFSYVEDIGYDTFLFLDPDLIQHKQSTERLTVIERSLDSLPTNELILKHGKTVQHAMFDGDVHPGHVLYAIANNAKVFLVQEIMDQYDYDLYIWIDAGISHGDPYPYPRDSLESLPRDKIMIPIINWVQVSKDNVTEYWSLNRYNVAGGLMAFPKDLMPAFMDKYLEALTLARQLGFVCLEEQIIPLLLDDKLFDYRFTDYRLLSNLKYLTVTSDIDVIIRNLPSLPSNIAMQLIKYLISSLEYGSLRCNIDQFCFIMYYAHIKSFYCDKSMSDRLARIIKALVTYQSNNNSLPTKSHFNVGRKLKEKFPNIEQNISYNEPLDIKSSWFEYCKTYHEDVKIFRLFL